MCPDAGSDDAAIKVAVIGGGCAALAAAFELTRPEHGGRYAVTVYQMGWRLGGKGASGRGVNGRIEEHGLHLWMGYYENAFRLMRACYAELNTAAPNGRRWRFDDAFAPANYVGAMDWSPPGRWLPWKVDFPPSPGLPGDPNPPRFGVIEYVLHAARLLRTLLTTLPAETEANPPSELRAEFEELRRRRSVSPDDLTLALARLVKFSTWAGLAAAIEATSWLELVFESLPRFPQSLIARLLDLIGELLRAPLAKLASADDEVRRLAEVSDLILATIRGSIRFRLAFDPRGFDAIDEYDCREWLRMNGASEQAINSAFIRALYDLAFAYEGGDTARPAIAAGTALRGAFRAFFSYRGAFFWKMNAGMGDAVFAPLYEVLRRRGVRFEFFHKLVQVELGKASEGPPHVAALHFDVQARTSSGDAYQPLCTVQGLPCWPSRPQFAQLSGGAELEAADIDFESQWETRRVDQKTLRVSADFDFVVLGVGLGVVASVCKSIVERDERWRNMLARVKSVPTQAFQIWLDRSAEELGWVGRSINLSGFVEPFDTWADMTHLAPMESWSRPPRTIAYFCNVLAETGEPESTAGAAAELVSRAHEQVRANCVRFLDDDIAELWPAAHAERRFCWEALLADADPARHGTGPDRFRTQYWTANVRPSDRYSQSLPGSTRYRISPLDRSYDNLTVAGDWTNSGLNMGCVEAAVMSGLLAANALSGFPSLDDIVGYDHP